jgi:hypothetical protein
MLPYSLKNGATVIQEKTTSDKNVALVLAFITNASYAYVTWKLDKDGNVYWGHYFRSLEEAQSDFNERT